MCYNWCEVSDNGVYFVVFLFVKLVSVMCLVDLDGFKVDMSMIVVEVDGFIFVVGMVELFDVVVVNWVLEVMCIVLFNNIGG